jgi:hypothetical protein
VLSPSIGNNVTRDHDVGQLTKAELERTMRDLRANLGLISPDSPAHVPILAHMQAIDAELARRAGSQQPDVGQRHDGGIHPGPSPATLPGDIDRDKETP